MLSWGVVTRLVLGLIMSRISAGRSATVDDRTTTTGTERRCSPGLQARHTRACHRQPSSAALAASLLASPVQAVLSYALYLSREVSGLPIQHREACRPQSFTRRPTIFFNNELRDPAATDKMWRARLFSRWPCRVERSTRRHACCFWLCAF